MYICSDTVKGRPWAPFQVLPSKVVRDDDFQTVMEAWERDYLVSEQWDFLPILFPHTLLICGIMYPSSNPWG